MTPQKVNASKLFPSLTGLEVLLVEDENDVREVLTIVLQRCGATVRAASSAREALDMIDKTQPDVLVTDIAMPIEDGYDLLKKIRALDNSRAAKIPAVALTGYAGSEDRKRAMAAGFQMHLPKPVDPEQLAAAVASLALRSGSGSIPL